MVHLPRLPRLHHQPAAGAQPGEDGGGEGGEEGGGGGGGGAPGADEVLVHGPGGEERRDGRAVGPDLPVGEYEELVLPGGGLRLPAQAVDLGAQVGGVGRGCCLAEAEPGLSCVCAGWPGWPYPELLTAAYLVPSLLDDAGRAARALLPLARPDPGRAGPAGGAPRRAEFGEVFGRLSRASVLTAAVRFRSAGGILSFWMACCCVMELRPLSHQSERIAFIATSEV